MANKMGLTKGIFKSNELYERAKKVIASGTNTFSRAPGVFPDGVAPKFLNRQNGSHVWDVDGNEYIDMVMGCGPVTIGHNYPAINDAITKQNNPAIATVVNLGVSFLHLSVTENTEKPIDEVIPKRKPINELFSVFPMAIIIIPIVASAIEIQTLIEIFSFKNR